MNQAYLSQYNPYYDYMIKVTYTSTYSKKGSSSIALEQFILRLTVNPICLYNKITKTSELPNFTYTVSSSATTALITPLYTTSLSVSSCPLTGTLSILDSNLNTWQPYSASPTSWLFMTFNTSTGIISVLQTVRATYAPFNSFVLQINISDTQSNKQSISY